MSLSLDATASAHGTEVGLIVGERALTWADVATRATDIATTFPVDGAPLPIVARRTEETVLTMLAAIDAGLAIAPIHPRLAEAPPGELDSALPARAGADVLAYLRTSGSTGPARIAVLPRRAFEASAAASAHVLPLGPGDRWLLTMPLSHVGGLSILTRVLCAGAAAAIAPEGSFDAAETVARMREQDITHASLVPTMLARILDAGLEAPPTLRTLLIGGAAASGHLLARARAAGFSVLPTYGLTEACSQVATRRPGDEDDAPGRVGPPLPGVDVRVVEGEIEVRGETLFDGYVSEVDASGSAPVATQAWFRTGDLGWLDDEGVLFVTGRRGDLIITGGENVHPAEVEAVLLSHPGIRAACVVGVPDEEWGERVVAAVVGESVAGQEGALLEWLRPRLAAHQRPRALRVVAALPETATGKLRRGEVRRVFMSG